MGGIPRGAAEVGLSRDAAVLWQMAWTKMESLGYVVDTVAYTALSHSHARSQRLRDMSNLVSESRSSSDCQHLVRQQDADEHTRCAHINVCDLRALRGLKSTCLLILSTRFKIAPEGLY